MLRINDEPLVTVVVHTYNHENYISECLEGIIAQEAFSYLQILIIEDHSTDHTLELCKQYEKAYPGKITLIALPENEMSQGLVVGVEHLKSIRTKYVAWCDGDDYWIDSRKISKQIEVLENHRFGIVHSNYLFSENMSGVASFRERSPSEILKSANSKGGLEFVQGNNIKHSTAMIPRAAIDFDFVGGAKNIYAGDWLICVSATQELGVYYIPEVTTVARFTKQGVWNGSNLAKNRNQKLLVREYCAANLPKSKLRFAFRRRVLLDRIRGFVSSTPMYGFIRPVVLVGRKSIRSALIKVRGN